MDANDKRQAELAEMVRQIRERVRQSYPTEGAADLRLADLMPVVHARDAAEGKAAAIGSVNPRPPGLLNDVAQAAKKMVARSLNWHVREQVDFNRLVLRCVDALLEALNESNQAAAQLSHRLAAADRSGAQDLVAHWTAWRSEWERKLAANETSFLRAAGEQNAAYQNRTLQLETSVHAALASTRDALETIVSSLQTTIDRQAELLEKQRQALDDAHRRYEMLRVREDRLELAFRETVAAQHEAYRAALARASEEIQARLEVRLQDEIRPVRQRAIGPMPGLSINNRTAAFPAVPLDWTLFAQKFRGPEEKIREGFRRYVPHFRGAVRVLDLGCGRGEFLELMREEGVEAIGVDQAPDSLAACHEKGLRVEAADLFRFLEAEPDHSVGGVFCAQVIEHLPPPAVPYLVSLCHRKLKPGGPLVLETPNPECLAIFASHFYIDPTHTRPIPPVLLEFYLSEVGFVGIETTRFAPAVESMPSVASLPDEFQRQFFGSLDYAVFARKPS